MTSKHIGALALGIAGLLASFPIYRATKTRHEVQRTLEGDHWLEVSAWHRAHPCSSSSKVFLGDSLTEMFDLAILEDPDAVNRGISGDFTSGVLSRLDEITAAQPAKIFIGIGTNDIVEKVPLDEIEQNYEGILRRISTASPRTRIFVQSVFPTALTGSFITSNQNINGRVDDLNEKLKMLAAQVPLDLH